MVLVFTLTSTCSCYRPTSTEPVMVMHVVCWAEGSGARSILNFSSIYPTRRNWHKSVSCYALASRASMFQKSRGGEGETICPLSDCFLEGLIPYSSNFKKTPTNRKKILTLVSPTQQPPKEVNSTVVLHQHIRKKMKREQGGRPVRHILQVES